MEEAKMFKTLFTARFFKPLGMSLLAGTVTAAVLPLAGHSADMAKEGTDSTTHTWMVTSPTNPLSRTSRNQKAKQPLGRTGKFG
jgi:hypothetical protein